VLGVAENAEDTFRRRHATRRARQPKSVDLAITINQVDARRDVVLVLSAPHVVVVDAVNSVGIADFAGFIDEDGQIHAKLSGELAVLFAAPIDNEGQLAVHLGEKAAISIEVRKFPSSRGAVLAACEIKTDHFAALLGERPGLAEAIDESEIGSGVAVFKFEHEEMRWG
jgi:hypothetical protein